MLERSRRDGVLVFEHEDQRDDYAELVPTAAGWWAHVMDRAAAAREIDRERPEDRPIMRDSCARLEPTAPFRHEKEIIMDRPANRPDEINTYQPGVAVEWRSPRDGWQPGRVVEVTDGPSTSRSISAARPTWPTACRCAVSALVYVAHTGRELDPHTHLAGYGPLTRLTLAACEVRPVAWSACCKCGAPITDPDNVPHDQHALCSDCGDPC